MVEILELVQTDSRKTGANSMQAIAAGSVLIWKFVILFKFVIGLQFSASVSRPSLACKSLAATLSQDQDKLNQ